MDEVEAIERATLAAVPPEGQEEHAGWLLAFDRGTVGRAHSAVPLAHTLAVAGGGADIVACYRERGFQPVLRLPDVAPFEPLHAQLTQSGLAAARPTLVQVASIHGFTALAPRTDVTVRQAPDASWSSVFLGEGFDPVDGASRLAILGRGRHSLFASVVMEGATVAVGCAGFAHGWCGIHGMRTLPAWRGRGLAGAIISTLAAAARERGIQRAFLQVEEGNASARRLYAQVGFATRWQYRYWG